MFETNYSFSLILQSTNEGLRDVSGSAQAHETKEAWSELVVYVDHHMITQSNRKLVIRCETNIYSLYKGAAENELQVMDDNYWVTGGKVSPTTDLRGGANRGDPDNSALTGGAAILLAASGKYMLLRIAILYLVFLVILS